MMLPLIAWGVFSPQIGELNCPDIIIQIPYIVGAQTMCKYTKYSVMIAVAIIPI